MRREPLQRWGLSSIQALPSAVSASAQQAVIRNTLPGGNASMRACVWLVFPRGDVRGLRGEPFREAAMITNAPSKTKRILCVVASITTMTTGAALIGLPAWMLVLVGSMGLAVLYIVARQRSRYDPLAYRK